MFFDPQTHTERGVPIGDRDRRPARAPAPQAERELGVERALILCFLRHLSEDEALATLEARAAAIATSSSASASTAASAAIRRRSSPACSRAAASSACTCVAHAGEEGPPAYICERARRAAGRAHRPRRALPRGPGAGRAAGARAHAADGLPAVEPQALRRSPRWRSTTCAELLDAGLVRHRQLRRPGLLRRLHQRQLRRDVRGAAAARRARMRSSSRATASRPASPTPARKAQWQAALDRAFADA